MPPSKQVATNGGSFLVLYGPERTCGRVLYRQSSAQMKPPPLSTMRDSRDNSRRAAVVTAAAIAKLDQIRRG